MLLALKLALVPAFLAALTVAGRVWGPSVAGWLAGLPVVAGPIVLLLALERGPAFAAQASAASIAAIAASEAFNFAYAWTCRRSAWPLALMAGMLGWAGVAMLLTHLPGGLIWAVAAGCVAVAISQSGLPRVAGHVPAARVALGDLVLRMLAGTLLTVAVTTLSASMGATWSGLLSVSFARHRARGIGAARARRGLCRIADARHGDRPRLVCGVFCRDRDDVAA